MLQDTACENCPYKQDGKQCPNYIETIWHENDNPQPRVVRDCAPKRNLLLTQELYNRTFSLQKQISQQESEILDTKCTVKQLISAIQYIQEQKEIENSAKKKYIDHLSSFKGIA